jgi:hypothetical protein
MTQMPQVFSQALRNPFKRIYLIWGVVVILGFILSGMGFFEGYGHWYVLTLIGLSSQIIGMRLERWQAKVLLALWAIISLGGTLKNHLDMIGLETVLTPFIIHIGIFWLLIIGIGQVITGFVLKRKYQTLLGIVWTLVSLILWNPYNYGLDAALVFYGVGFIIGLPYLYIALKR